MRTVFSRCGLGLAAGVALVGSQATAQAAGYVIRDVSRLNLIPGLFDALMARVAAANGPAAAPNTVRSDDDW